MHDHDLKKHLKSIEIPASSEEAKQRALQAAMEAFEAQKQENVNLRQGSLEKPRPIPAKWFGTESVLRRFTMQKSYIFAGSLAAVSVALLLTTTHYSTIMDPVMGTPKPAAPVQTPFAAQQPELVQSAGVKKEQDSKNVELLEKSEKAKLAPESSVAANKPEEQVALPEPVSSPPASVAPPAPPPPPPPPSPLAFLRERERSAKDDAAHMPEKKVAAKESVAATAGRHANMALGQVSADMMMPQPPIYVGQDKFENFKPNAVKLVRDEPVSTFSIDVDTSSYSFVRRQLNAGVLPQPDAVRVEEMVNYFDYDIPLATSKDEPFKPTITVMPSPWNASAKLVHIGIKGYDIEKAEKPRSNLVFLIDVSGSMNSPDKLPLLKNAMRMLVENLSADDTVGIVVYAGSVGTVLEPTKGADRKKIVEAIDRLESGGSTAGAEGIRQAYALAEAHFDKKAVNRVMLATDGDFNVGITNPEELKRFVERKRDSGIFLSVLGFGQGNYNDALMQKLAQNGNGNAAYIDSLSEARKVLVEEAGATLFPIAKDVKLQVEFNPQAVTEYRLIGYESRMLNREDFNNDKVDAGDIGAGHEVTAIYEITPAGAMPSSGKVDDLRYGQPQQEVSKPVMPKEASAFSGEYGFLKIRYKLPSENTSKLISAAISEKQEVTSIQQASDDARFAVSVAGFGQILKGEARLSGFTYDDVITLADSARGKDTFGYRSEFLSLVRLAKNMQMPYRIQDE